jgi:hypothetical protein
MSLSKKYFWGIGTEFELAIVENLLYLEYLDTKYNLKNESNNSLIKTFDTLKEALDNDVIDYNIDGYILNNEDLGIGHDTNQKIDKLLKSGKKFKIIKVYNPIDIVKDDVEGMYGQNIYTIDKEAIGMVSKDFFERYSKVFRDLEILKTPTGKTTTFLILEISTENFMNKTIDEHIIDSQNNVIGDVSTKILGTKTFYDNQLYHYFYEKIQNNVDSNLMEQESKLVNIGRLGAIHLNITMPIEVESVNAIKKEKNIENIITQDFYKEHERLAFVIQLLNPLFLGFYGMPDNRSFLDDQNYTRSSLRSLVNRFGNSPFSGYAQFSESVSLSKARREPGSCSDETYDTIFIEKLNTTFNNKYKDTPYTKSNLGCDINRRIEKDRDQLFGFEIRNIDYYGYTNMDYYKSYIQLVFLINYYLLHNIELCNRKRRELPTIYENLINSIFESYKNGFYAKMDDIYISFITELFDINLKDITSMKKIPINLIPFIYTKLYNFLEENKTHSRYDIYKNIIGERFADIISPNKNKMIQILEWFGGNEDARMKEIKLQIIENNNKKARELTLTPDDYKKINELYEAKLITDKRTLKDYLEEKLNIKINDKDLETIAETYSYYKKYLKYKSKYVVLSERINRKRINI